MTVEVRGSDLNSDVTVLVMSGRYDMVTVEEDSSTLLDAIGEGSGGVALDMTGVSFLSSSGLRMLLSAQQKWQASEKKAALFGTQPAVYKIFKVSALDGLFQFCEDEAAAVDAVCS